MKCISIKQPWAWLVANGFKDIENRDWFTSFRGEVFIHAGKYVPYQDECDEIEKKFKVKLPDDFEVGGIVGRARIADCVEKHDSRWFFGRYGFVVADARPVPFIAMIGKLGLFEVSADIYKLRIKSSPMQRLRKPDMSNPTLRQRLDNGKKFQSFDRQPYLRLEPL